MKNSNLFLAALLAGMSFQTVAQAQTARLEVIHNSADAAAQTVDIYVNGGATPFIDDFQFRTTSEALKKGKTLHYAPREGTYVISRYTDDEQVILILNKNSETRELLPEQYPELQLEENTLFFDVLSTKNEVLEQRLTIPASSFRLISIRK